MKYRTIAKHALNPTYAEIIAKGFSLDVTTGGGNKGNLWLVKDGVALHKAGFSSHGEGTTALLTKLPTCYRHGSMAHALHELKDWTEFNQVAPLTTEDVDPFIDSYNTALSKFSPTALARVREVQKINPDLTFDQLFGIWYVEIQYLLRTENALGR